MNLPTQPHDVHARLAEAYNTGDINTVMTMYDFNGILVSLSPEKLFQGKLNLKKL